MNLGTAIKSIRQQKGIKQITLSELSGVSQTYLSQIESNLKEPNLSTLKLIAEALDVPIPVIFFLSLEINDIKPEKRIAYKHLEPALQSMITEFFGTPITAE